jgi:hypothetical protein
VAFHGLNTEERAEVTTERDAEKKSAPSSVMLGGALSETRGELPR